MGRDLLELLDAAPTSNLTGRRRLALASGRADARRPGPARPVLLRGPPVGRRPQPRGHRRAGPPLARPRAPADWRHIAPTSVAAGLEPARLAVAAGHAADRRRGPARAARRGRDGARHDAHPRHRACRRRATSLPPSTSGPTGSRSTSRSCSVRSAPTRGPSGRADPRGDRARHHRGRRHRPARATARRRPRRPPGRRGHRPVLRPPTSWPGIMDVPPDALDEPLQELCRPLPARCRRATRATSTSAINSCATPSIGASRIGDRRRYPRPGRRVRGAARGQSEIHASVHFERAGHASGGVRDGARRRPGGGAISAASRGLRAVPPGRRQHAGRPRSARAWRRSSRPAQIEAHRHRGERHRRRDGPSRPRPRTARPESSAKAIARHGDAEVVTATQRPADVRADRRAIERLRRELDALPTSAEIDDVRADLAY